MKNKLIEQLNEIKGLLIDCPSCGEQFSAREARLFDMYVKYPEYAERELQRMWRSLGAREEFIKDRRQEMTERRKEIKQEVVKKPAKTQITTESVNFGKIAEKIVPSFPNFPYKPLDCRPLFEPIDYIVFHGLHKHGNISFIKIVDVKTGNAKTTQSQNAIRDALSAGRIKFRVDKGL